MINVTLFAKIIQALDRFSVSKQVLIHHTGKYHNGMNSGTYLTTMLFCQFSKNYPTYCL